MVEIDFVKMEGAGNDYIYLFALGEKERTVENTPEALLETNKREFRQDCLTGKFSARSIQNLCDRNLGIGSDGIIFVSRPEQTTDRFQMHMFNSDGGRSEMCGNGVRCLAAYLIEHYGVKVPFQVLTEGGIKTIQQTADKQVLVNMGRPNFLSAALAADFPDLGGKWQTLRFGDQEFLASLVSMGNPHIVLPLPSVDDFPLAVWGPQIEKDRRFANRVNVNLVEVVGPTRLKVRTWERGAGETLACGTGITASAILAWHNRLIPPAEPGKPVEVKVRGGELKVFWQAATQTAELAGPARISYRGRFLREDYQE